MLYYDLFNVINYRIKMAQDLLNIHPLLNDTNNDFLNSINNNVNNVGGTYTLSQVMDYIAWIGLEGTGEYISDVINTSGELAKKNFVENMSTQNYNRNCNN